ncbi:MAG: hypothetical protein J6Y02_01190 [Pseudobutyrivibrio sp.]|nr:hypothetical protein [Pseudobutyrivibrio sp.]
MGKVRLANNVKLQGVKNFAGKDKMIDYYLMLPNEKIYAFSKKYTDGAYDICKNGILVNELMTKKSRNTGVMKLVKYTNVIMPYFAEYYDLPRSS